MLKIAITGPESVGKSTLTKQLSEHFRCKFVSEYARDYIESKNGIYNYQDVEFIAHKQMNQYDHYNAIAESGYPIIFFDTFLMITKVWFTHVWNKQPEWLDEAIRNRPMDLYILCAPDIPWEADKVRENGTIRDELFLQYKKELENYNQQYVVITGTGQQRFENCLLEIARLGITIPS